MKILTGSWLCVWLFLLASSPAIAQIRSDREAYGEVHAVDFGSQSVVISGLRYYFTADAQVEIDDSHGAWSMLRPGQNVRFTYRRPSKSRREIFELETLSQLPDDWGS